VVAHRPTWGVPTTGPRRGVVEDEHLRRPVANIRPRCVNGRGPVRGPGGAGRITVSERDTPHRPCLPAGASGGMSAPAARWVSRIGPRCSWCAEVGLDEPDCGG
jgi:hypothetical protein